jgi:hypothetical protein
MFFGSFYNLANRVRTLDNRIDIAHLVETTLLDKQVFVE